MIKLIKQEVADLLSTTVNQIVLSCSKSECIDAIYMGIYAVPSNISEYLGQSVIEITLVYNSLDYRQDLDELDITLKKVKEKTGYEIKVIHSSSVHYKKAISNIDEVVACRELVNGQLLYDRTGNYREIQIFLSGNQNRPLGLFEYENQVSFVPPLQLSKVKK